MKVSKLSKGYRATKSTTSDPMFCVAGEGYSKHRSTLAQTNMVPSNTAETPLCTPAILSFHVGIIILYF